MSAVSNAQRQAEFVIRQKAAGLVKVNGLWAHPDDIPAIRKKAASLARSRAKKLKE